MKTRLLFSLFLVCTLIEQTKEHAQRLQQILSNHQQTTRGPKCKGMEGLVAEGAEMIEEEADEVGGVGYKRGCCQVNKSPRTRSHLAKLGSFF